MNESGFLDSAVSGLPLEQLVSLLRCPACRQGDLTIADGKLRGVDCAHTFRMERGVPVLLEEDRAVEVMPDDHESNLIDDSVLDWLDSFDGYSLNIGAGSTRRVPSRGVELEYSVFRHTGTVADAHNLPFKDGVFDAVVSYNTFEHLADPALAGREILRVLKPGGKLRLQTAFLQPLHERPAHYYGATVFGVTRWFDGFEIDECFVPGNMSPAYALGWITALLLHFVESEHGADARRKLGSTNLAHWEHYWHNRFVSTWEPPQLLSSLSQFAQSHLAFGFEIQATSPVTSGYRPASASNAPKRTKSSRLDLADLLTLLRCPSCRKGALEIADAGLLCCECGHRFRVQRGVPILLEFDREVDEMPDDHESNEVDPDVLDWLDSLAGFSLNIGAGSTRRLPSGCVELEYSLFRNTGTVADAHNLPFNDGVFDAVISYNTFEHLAEPQIAAAEILRVLRPGGELRLQTAFLQPLHEEPAHFFNATEFGIRRWFADFTIGECFVPPNMSPAHMLGWLSNHVLHHIRANHEPDIASLAGQITVNRWARRWTTPEMPHSSIDYLFADMPQFDLSRFSAGFEIRATKPEEPVQLHC